jgi:SNF2 family DNA or RNA helicase
LPDPAKFFALFDQLQQQSSSSTATKLFFGTQKRFAPKKSKLNLLCEAAFGLLQWAHHGEPYELVGKQQNGSSSSSSNSSDSEEAEELLDEEASVVEDEVPAWAKLDTTPAMSQLPELEAPKEFKVPLRPYQRQALWWMTQREAQEELEESSRQQLQLLQELAAATSSSSSTLQHNRPPSSKSRPSIHCDCGPVLVDQDPEKGVQAPSVVDNGTNPNLNHPLWERRYLTDRDRSQALSFYVQPLFGMALPSPPPPPTPCRGGILADSMGLGKTVMLLALMQANASENIKGTTLIVGPLSLLAQWEAELESKTTLSHRVHYGDKKGLQDFDAVDVVLTTCKYYLAWLMLVSLSVHSLATFVIPDGTLQGEWISHSKRKEEGDRNAVQWTGLLGHSWKRVILDEAHCIKNSATVANRACCLLKAERRWCVSGTIIQNSLEDVFALLKFLNHEPWCEHSFWKAAISKEADQTEALDRVRRVLTPIMLRRTKESVDKDG